MLNFFFIETKADTESTLDRTATKLFFRVVTTADYAFSLAMRKNYSFHRFDSCAGPPGICFFHAHSSRWKAKHNPLINCIHIHSFGSINVEQASLSADKRFFRTEEFSDTPLLRMHFHVRWKFFRLPFSCYLQYGK